MNAKDALEIGIARYRRMLNLEPLAREGNACRQEEIERDGKQGNGGGVMRHERLPWVASGLSPASFFARISYRCFVAEKRSGDERSFISSAYLAKRSSRSAPSRRRIGLRSPRRAKSTMRAAITSLAELSSCNFSFSQTASRAIDMALI